MEGYAGKISQSGTQIVKAPSQTAGKKGKSQVKTGDDLRNGRGK